MKKLLFFFIVFLPILASAQQVQDALNHELSSVKEKNLYLNNSNFHTSIRPFFHHEIQQEINNDSITDLLKKITDFTLLVITGGQKR